MNGAEHTPAHPTPGPAPHRGPGDGPTGGSPDVVGHDRWQRPADTPTPAAPAGTEVGPALGGAGASTGGPGGQATADQTTAPAAEAGTAGAAGTVGPGGTDVPGPPLRPDSSGERQIQRRLDTVQRADRFYQDQMLDHLNSRMREFIQRQEMFFLATADRNGECDNSFRAGPPGFLQVVDERTLVYPEYRGNGVHASLGNILENPHVGILLVDFLQARIGLHVNGRAELVEDEVLRAEHPEFPVDPVPGRRARMWVRVTVEEAYIHCAKHIPHLQKAQGPAGRDWGTDDYKRKGGDFFGVAREAREARRRRALEEGRRTPRSAAQPAIPVPRTPVDETDAARPEAEHQRPAVTGPGAAAAHQPDPAAPASHARHRAEPRPDTPHGDGAQSSPQPYPSSAATPAAAFAAPSAVPGPSPAPTATPTEDRGPQGPAAPTTPHPTTAENPTTTPAAGSTPAAPPTAPTTAAPTPPSTAPLPAAVLASTPDPQAWVQEAERALNEARRRGRDIEEGAPFQGWFG